MPTEYMTRLLNLSSYIVRNEDNVDRCDMVQAFTYTNLPFFSEITVFLSPFFSFNCLIHESAKNDNHG